MEAFLSIIIPVYQIEEDYLRKCLDSLKEQTSCAFKAILIDDGSPDRCGRICDEYAQGDERFLVIHQENQGVSEARNMGIKAADTEWIIFVDPDDWVEPDLVETLNVVMQTSYADILFYDYYYEFPQKQVKKTLKENGGELDDKWKKQLRLAPFNFFAIDGRKKEYATNTVWNKMFRISLIRERGIWFDAEARKGQDTIFVSEILQCTDAMYYVDKALYHYRFSEGSVTNRYNPKVLYYNEISFKRQKEIIEKYRLPVEYRRALYAYICTRMYSAMRLYFFNENNQEPRPKMKTELLYTLEREPYKTALAQVRYADLSWEQKVFIFLLKHRMLGFIRPLVKVRRIWKGTN